MIDTNELQPLQPILAKTIQQLQTSNETYRICSITSMIVDHSPLDLFQAAKKMGLQRMFWSSAADQITMVGIGNVHVLQPDTTDISDLQDAWNELFAHSEVFNPFEQAGTGLVAMGGMAFDPFKKKTDLWKDFPDKQMVIPEFVLTKTKEHCFLTYHVKVHQEDHSHQLANMLYTRKNQLFSMNVSFSSDASVVSKQPVAPREWKALVSGATDAIKQGVAKKIVLARELRLKLSSEVDAGTIIKRLLHSQQNSYVFAISYESDCFVGATPERLVKLDKSKLLSTCLAGTAPRGKDKETDMAIGKALLKDPKNRQEHDFVVQMIKKAIEPYATNLIVPSEPVLYPLKNLQHLYTPVSADIDQKHGIFPIVDRLHPTPALGGAPKGNAVKFIREHELLDRGWYGAPIGWLDGQNNGEFAVAIRSGLLQGDKASLFAGCGVVADSDPEIEFAETDMKLLPMLHVLEGATK